MSVPDVAPEELEAIRAELPELDLVSDPAVQRQVAAVWWSFLRDSEFDKIADAPALPGIEGVDLAKHTRQVTASCAYLAHSTADFWGIECDMPALLAAALTHDASKLVEFDARGQSTEIGQTFLHAQLAGVRCMEAGLPLKVAHLVTYHPFTPPHVHITPRCIEFVLLTWADLAAVDTIFYAHGHPTHLEITKRFFSLD